MIEDIHPNSKIGTARSQLETLRGRVQPLEEQLKTHKAERLQKQTLVERATLDTPAIEVATAESRIRLLDKGIARQTDELTPLLQQLQTAERDLALLEGDAEYKRDVFPELQDALNPDLSHYSIARWMELLRDGRKAVQELTEAPLALGVRYEPVVTVSFRLMGPGEELEKRGHSASERRHLASVEQQRAMERSIAAGVLASEKVEVLTNHLAQLQPQGVER